MKRFPYALVTLLAACAGAADGDEAALPPVTLTPLSDAVWMHSSYAVIEPWGPVLTNGLVVEAEAGVWLVDTAWTDEQTDDVLALVVAQLGRPVTHAVFTHAHDDKMGGVDAVRDAGIATFAHPLSNELAPARGLVPAARDLVVAADGALTAEGAPGGLSLFYPGPAHTTDNIVAYVPKAAILFGGCMIRPQAATSLGNASDADVPSWSASARAVAARFPDAEIVVPSHGAPGTAALLDATARLADAAD